MHHPTPGHRLLSLGGPGTPQQGHHTHASRLLGRCPGTSTGSAFRYKAAHFSQAQLSAAVPRCPQIRSCLQPPGVTSAADLNGLQQVQIPAAFHLPSHPRGPSSFFLCKDSQQLLSYSVGTFHPPTPSTAPNWFFFLTFYFEIIQIHRKLPR